MNKQRRDELMHRTNIWHALSWLGRTWLGRFYDWAWRKIFSVDDDLKTRSQK